MDLRTFVQETLCQISDGIADAQEKLKDKGVLINPPHAGIDGAIYVCDYSRSDRLQSIDFDIAVTASDTNGDHAKGNISVMAANLGRESKQEHVDSSVSRIRFQIWVRLPQSIFEGRKNVY